MKLPRGPYKKHPALKLLDYVEDKKTSLRKIALPVFGVSQQALSAMLKEARENRDYLVPPRHVPTFSELTGVPRHYFNPNLWPKQ